MRRYFSIELQALIRNLLAGAQLAVFRRRAFRHFNIRFDQAVYIICFNLAIMVVVDYLTHLPDPEFNTYAVSGFALQILGLLITGFVVLKLSSDNDTALAFIIQTCSFTPFYYLCFSVLIPPTLPPPQSVIYDALLLWYILVMGFIFLNLLERSVGKTVILLFTYTLFLVTSSFFVPSGEFWYTKIDDTSFAKYNSLDQEKLYYDQFDHLTTIRHDLLPGRPKSTDLYFLGFGSYAREDVFMKEIHYIRDLMDNRFNTKGRSVALINNLHTIDQTPLATKSNLTRVISILGNTMDKQEDVLFLYLTSHGSRKPELSVSFWPLQLHPISPNDLKTALDAAGIKWRILLVSACYSGGFLAPLKNTNTLIMTAAAHDRTSFGCGSKSDFTYFGRAVFVEQLANNFSFIPAFKQAIQSITAREKREKRKPSLPQLYIGQDIEQKLSLLEKEIKGHYNRSQP